MSILNKVNEKNFDDFKRSLRTNKIVFKFWAPWCSPCVKYGPVFKDFVEQDNSNVVFAEINIDEDESGFFIKKFDIKSIPITILVDSDMNILNRSNGVLNSEDLKEFVKI